MGVRIFTIGFTKTSAKDFFERLKASGARRIIDVRLNNVSQLAGFAKKDDLAYFASEICCMDYRHLPALAPTKELLDTYRKSKGSWDDYAKKFLRLIEDRRIENLKPDQMDGACLLCSEDKPHHCHRRLVAEYLKSRWGDVQIRHL
ncbi:MAG TPA: DUF488 domain-containing protein [Allosphingosinicella sp.]|jgi:uncharacterized protein (DUF488 family)